MPVKNRELSQFASLLQVTNVGKDILIAPDADSYVGLGTDNVQYKLHVIGDTNISGDIFVGGDMNLSGILTAGSFYDQFGNQLVSFDSWTISGPNVYRLGGVGIGTSTISETLTVEGNSDISGTVTIGGTVQGNRFISTTITESPLQVSSQIRVTNLNADYLREGIPGGNSPSDIVTISDTQTLSNKTLSSPTLQGTVIFGNVSLTSAAGTTLNVTMPTTSGRLITDQDGVIGLVTTGKIQNGTILDEDIANSTITGSKLANNTITNAKLQNSTISGISLGSNLNTLTINSSYLTVNPISYNGSSAVSSTLNATPNNTANHIVARDGSGNFSAAQINVQTLVVSSTVTTVNLTASGTVTAQDFNSTSDINLKKNIHTIENSFEIINRLNGVRFDWKSDNSPSMGVIAQELEKVAPELVKEIAETKSVNYNGIVAILIEAVKELKQEINNLKSI